MKIAEEFPFLPVEFQKNLDAVGIAQTDKWTFSAFKGEDFLQYTREDRVQKSNTIKQEFTFLPAEFQEDLDAAAIAIHNSQWIFSVFKGKDFIEFSREDKITKGPRPTLDEFPYLPFD